MKRKILREAVKLNMEHRRRKWWHRIVSGMAALVVFVTTYALILPVITMEQETVCGLVSHTHSDACYYTPKLKLGRDFICPHQLHQHQEACYGADGVPNCLYADFAVHYHDSFCFDADGNRVCGLSEHTVHTHSEACYGSITTYGCGLEEGEGSHTHGETCYSEPEWSCGMAEGPGHSHTAECYGAPPLICTQEETKAAELSVTDDEASGETAENGQPEMTAPTENPVIHTHGEECYGQPELICTQEELPAHTHGDECALQQQMICMLEENPGHSHDETCVVETGWQLTCEKEVVVLHTHSDACLDAAGNLICGLWQIEAHQHSENCFADHVHVDACYRTDESGTVLVCDYHVHEDNCTDASGQLVCGQSVLICGLEEHTHRDSCYPEEDSNEMTVRFEIPEEYSGYIQSEATFPAEYTLEQGSSIAELEGFPLVTVRNPDESTPVYLPDYHWTTPDGFPADESTAVNENLVLTLQLYPVEAPEAAKLVTATFAFGDEVFLSKTVNSGMIVSDILDESVMQRLDELQGELLRFDGWSYSDQAGQTVAMEPGVTVIQTDTTFYAVFREYIPVTLHDIDSEGKEYPGSPRDVYLPVGSTLAEHGDILLNDGTSIDSCLWYTYKGEPYPLDVPLAESMHLYTYSYTLLLDIQPRELPETVEETTEPVQADITETTLPETMAVPSLFKAAFAAEVGQFTEQSDISDSEKSENILITKRRGVPLTESDFLVDGVNYTDYQWQDESGNDVDADDLVGTSLTSNYALVLAADSDYTIRYYINVSQNNLFGNSPTIGGETYLEDPYNTSDGSYTIRIPNPTQYMVTNGNKRTLYQFTGWKISRSGNIIAAGETVNASWVKNNVNRWQTYVTLTAQWTPVTVTETVHFFVNLNCQVVDVDGNTGVPDSGSFTPSVYSTTMTVTGSNMRSYWQGPINRDSYSTQYVVLRADTASQTEAIDSEIRRLITGHDSTNDRYNGNSVWKSGYTGTKIFQVDDFPSDEHVLRVVRDMVSNGTVIRMNGVALTADELTSDNFTVRWNVCKYDTGDGWHIDGVLVGKQAHLTVKKVFLGDDAAVQAVKDDNYSITLDNTTNSDADLTLTLNPAAAETGTNCIGYTAYDLSSDTYTWTVPLQQDNYYTIKENNYLSFDDAVQTSALYTISNSPDAFAGWETYPQNGIPGVKAYAYASDMNVQAYQTVMIRNSYVKSDTLTINKIDMDTGHGLAGISYRLADSSGNPLVLYQKPGTSYYSMKAEDLDNGFEQIPDSIITTGNNGTIFIKLESGIFTLEEAFPTGYGGVSKITVTVGVDSSGSVVFDEISSSDSTIEVDGTLVDKNTATLTVRNVSIPTTVTAQKVWTNSADAKPVTIALFRNGVDMGSAYQATLSDSNHWTHTWNDLPLYVDGGAAKYTLREIKIGDTNHDPSADNDGYAGYIVAYDEMAYYKNGTLVPGPVWTDANGVVQYADNAKLVVRNEVYRGQMMFLKVDGDGLPLAGATFRLYSDAAQTRLVAEATSDAYGRVVFENLMPDTYYVLKESDTPTGYVGGDSLYKVRLSSQGSTTLEDAATGEPLLAIVNYQDKATVMLKKVNMMGNTLSNAQFLLEVQREGSWVSVDSGITDDAGMLSLGELQSGYYRLTEMKAPDGFTPLPEPILFTIEQAELSIENPHTLWSAEKDADGGFVITVTNKTGYVLPRTGGITPQVYTNLGLALILAALIVALIKRRKGASPY